MSASQPAPDAAASASPVVAFIARHPQAVVLTCFFLSGATGLVYEVVWSRRLTLVFGATVLAVSTVLAAFLGGLALGSLIFGRLADRRRDPLRLYALLEAGVGLICFLTPLLFVGVEKAYLGLYPLIGDHVVLLRLVRFALAGLVLLAPTILMGGTLPVLSRAVVSQAGEVGRRVAGLYGLNTLGAVMGALGAGFLFIPNAGIQGTIHLAAIVNLAIAAVAYAVHATGRVTVAESEPLEGPDMIRPAVPGACHKPTGAADGGPDDIRPLQRQLPWLLVAYGLSGAAALIYEVGWTRILSASFGVTTYAFSAMLAAFLAGIGIGSLLLASPRFIRLDSLRAPLLWFGLVEVAIGLSVTLLTPLLGRMPLTFLTLYRTIGPHFMALQFAALGVAILIMLLPAGLMGVAFPLVTHLATEHVGVLGRRLSGVYAANTAGTVLGSFAAGFLLIPYLGVRHSLLVGVVLNVLIGAGALWASRRRQRTLAHVGLLVGLLSLASWAVLPDWNKAVLSSGAYLYADFYLGGDAQAKMEQKEVLHYRDALTCMISVTKVTLPGDEKPLISLQINGKTDASSRDLATQLLLAHLPALVHPKPEDVMMIGLASGCTLGGLELHPQVKQIDCVEIEPEMVRVTDYFRDINHNCLQDPRVRLTLDDARSFVAVSKRRYDVITSEPSNPWIAGIANLFTREFFNMCRDHLKPGGVHCQWVPIYNLSPADLRCVIATFQSSYRYTSLWMFTELASDAYLIGSNEPLQLDATDVMRRATQPAVAAALRDAGVTSPWHVLAGNVFNAGQLAAMSKGAPLNTDDDPVLEFSSPLSLYTQVTYDTMRQVLELAQVSKPPLVEDAASGRARVMGLRLRPPLRLTRPADLLVRHDATQMLRGEGPILTITLARAEAELQGAKVQLLAWPSTDLPPPGAPVEPTRPPDRTLQALGQPAQVWRESSEWRAKWSCPACHLTYMAVGAAPASPEAVLAALACER